MGFRVQEILGGLVVRGFGGVSGWGLGFRGLALSPFILGSPPIADPHGGLASLRCSR